MARRLIRALPLVLVPIVAMVASPASAVSVATASGPDEVFVDDYDGVETAVWSLTSANRTVVLLAVHGLPTDRVGDTLGAHVHVNKCDDASGGGHYGNPDAGDDEDLADTEIWLDFKVRPGGFGVAVAHADWAVASGDAQSIVVHNDPTNDQGGAGTRLFCTNVALGA